MKIDTNKIVHTNPHGLYESQAKALQELQNWWNSDIIEWTLEGFAGTGKTFLIKKFIEVVVNKTFAITAPTHKALSVMEKHLGIKGTTLQSLHGLKPDVDMVGFDIDNLKFNAIGRPKMDNYSLVIIDESSMINTPLFNLNRERATQGKIKILYIGDPLQLPPVKEKESKVFTDVAGITKLDKVIRQKDSNPLLHLFTLLRDDIKNNTSNCLSYIVDHPTNIKNNEGYKLVKLPEYKELLLEYFKDDEFYTNIDFVRATGFTNIAITNWNNYIRESIFDTNGDSLIVDDLITAYSTLVEDDNSVIITNSDDYIIHQIIKYRNEFSLDVYCVELKSVSTGKITKPLQILNHSDPRNVQRYTNHLSELRTRAIQIGGKKGWFPYYKFKNTVLCMINVEVGNKHLTRELDYGYSLTVHKLQGSTFKNIFVDGNDICNPISKWGRAYPTEINLRNRLLYVAISRATNIAYIKF